MAFRLEIVTPEGKAFADDITGVVLPGALGEMGVLPSHANLVSTLEPGELRYTRDGQTHELAVGAGFVEITGSHVNVLTDMAVGADRIDEAAVEQALARAQERLKDGASDLSDEEVAATEASILNSLAQLKLKRKRRTI
jgi:F-type H+-transporting ATPase subunit epsilon